MDTKQLENLIALVEEGNVREAALRQHISQPGLSMSIKRLEEVLKAFRQQGFEVDTTLADIRSSLTPTSSVVITAVADRLEIITPPIGILQMPAWQMAR